MSKYLAIVSLCACLSGCAFSERFGKAMTTPDPVTGVTPTATVVSNVPAVVTNPLNIPAWLQIIGALTGAFVTAYTGISVVQRRQIALANAAIASNTMASNMPTMDDFARAIVDKAVEVKEA
jgi:hypothetical protein